MGRGEARPGPVCPRQSFRLPGASLGVGRRRSRGTKALGSRALPQAWPWPSETRFPCEAVSRPLPRAGGGSACKRRGQRELRCPWDAHPGSLPASLPLSGPTSPRGPTLGFFWVTLPGPPGAQLGPLHLLWVGSRGRSLCLLLQDHRPQLSRACREAQHTWGSGAATPPQACHPRSLATRQTAPSVALRSGRPVSPASGRPDL